MDNEQLELLIEELGLIPSTFLTPTIKEQIRLEITQREFEPMNDLEKYFHQEFLKKLQKRRRTTSNATTVDDLILFENGLC